MLQIKQKKNEQFITTSFKLPNHQIELEKANEFLEKQKINLSIICKEKCINKINYQILYEEILRVLNYVGSLSIPAYNVRDELKNQYISTYHNSPQLAKQLWLQHFEDIHHPYNLIKTRCFQLIDKLDKEYCKKYKQKRKKNIILKQKNLYYLN